MRFLFFAGLNNSRMGRNRDLTTFPDPVKDKSAKSSYMAFFSTLPKTAHASKTEKISNKTNQKQLIISS